MYNLLQQHVFKHGQSIFDQTCLVCDKKQVFSCFICCVDIQDYFEWHMMINLQKNAVLNDKPLLQIKYAKRWLKLKSITHCILPPMHDVTTLLQTPAWSRLFNPGQRQPLTAARLTVHSGHALNYFVWSLTTRPIHFLSFGDPGRGPRNPPK